VTVKTVVMTVNVHANLNITPYIKALNLWDIEQRINQIQIELELLHSAKENLLGTEYDKLEYTERDQNLMK